ELLERFAHVRPLEHHDELAPNPPDDLLWHVRRTEHPAPWRDRQWTQARLRQRRRLRQERTAARQQRGQHLELALPHLRRGGPGGRDGELHPTAEKVNRQRPVSLVWKVHHVELLLLHELRRGEHAGAVAAAVVQLAGIGADVRQQLRDVVRRYAGVSEDEEPELSDERYGREIRNRIVRRVLAHRRQPREGGVGRIEE